MTINLNIPPQIHRAQVKAFEKENVKDKNLHAMDREFKTRLDETLYIRSKSWLPHFRDLREMTMYESHKSSYSIHSGSDKTHHNLKQLYQWPNMEAGIATYVRWNLRRGPKFTWEREDQFQKKYPYLFAKSVTAPNVTS
ncbi:putative reverse transcriptase domain-containing protein [Tanacetum coccineum]